MARLTNQVTSPCHHSLHHPPTSNLLLSFYIPWIKRVAPLGGWPAPVWARVKVCAWWHFVKQFPRECCRAVWACQCGGQNSMGHGAVLTHTSIQTRLLNSLSLCGCGTVSEIWYDMAGVLSYVWLLFKHSLGMPTGPVHSVKAAMHCGL